MIDDPGDLDQNGIPDSIQLDPVVVPASGEPPPDPGLPGIDASIEATADASAEPMPEPPVAPTPPPADADEATLLRYQEALREYSRKIELLSKVIEAQHDVEQAMIGNLRV